MSATMSGKQGDQNLLLCLLKSTKEGDVDSCKDVMFKIKESDNWQAYSFDKAGDTIGILATRWGKIEILRFLHEEHQLCLELSNFEGKRPLHEAAQFSQLHCLNYLISKGVDVNCLKRADWTPLMLACTKNDIDVVKELIENGADLHRKNKDGWNCFHVACREGHHKILNHLLDCNPDICCTVSKNGRTPLHTTALHGCKDATELLLTRCNYKPDQQDSCGTTPFMDAIRAGHTDVARTLVERQKVDVTMRDNMHRQPVHLAAEAGKVKSMEFLIEEHQVDLNARTNIGTTPLHYGAKEGHKSMLESLLESGADVTAVDAKNRTALHMASGGQFALCVQVLLKNGAVDARDSNGNLAEDLARKQNVKDRFMDTKVS